jgi:hypothetical protein
MLNKRERITTLKSKTSEQVNGNVSNDNDLDGNGETIVTRVKSRMCMGTMPVAHPLSTSNKDPGARGTHVDHS